MAQETGWELARVSRYAEPPIRERAYVAQCASEVQLHHSRGGATLEAVVCNSLGLTPGELNWDSAYVDGHWLVHIHTAAGAESAQWSYDPSGKSVNPLNPTARTLMGLDPARDTLTGSARESTIIVDTTSAQVQPQVPAIIQESAVAPVKLTAVPELVPEVVEIDQLEMIPVVVSAPATPAKKTRKGRTKVPSWDEILFGTNSIED